MEKTRVDKWLWAVRIFKTRSSATDACGKGRVSIEGTRVKASREIKAGDTISVRVPPVERDFLVKQVIDKRVSAPLAATCAEETTPLERLEILKEANARHEQRDRGTGRPTKRDRRMIDRLKEDN
ncbi:MAG: RNA-binding S4 domain-containing protein [Odoribacteraceae bacterium]|jgi:ribosome-associated heat shock protein Hsp15|nr:RNA-binding S4 domain-containing protein [Odoribacteraceae bacterium]